VVVDGYLVGPSADLAWADLVGADLADTDLNGADLTAANLTRANLTGITWGNTTCPDGTNSDNDDNTCIDNLLTADGIAQSHLNTALTNAKALYQSDSQSFPASAPMVAELATAEPMLTFTTGPSVSSTMISVTTSSDGNAIILSAQATTGNCWYFVDNVGGPETGSPPWSTPGAVFVDAGTNYGEVKNTGVAPTCQASSAPAGANSATQAFQTSGFPNL
jgi:hypothetical protein